MITVQQYIKKNHSFWLSCRIAGICGATLYRAGRLSVIVDAAVPAGALFCLTDGSRRNYITLKVNIAYSIVLGTIMGMARFRHSPSRAGQGRNNLIWFAEVVCGRRSRRWRR